MDMAFLEQCAPTVAPQTMASIVRTESAFRPHAIGYHITKDGKAYRLTNPPKNKDEAVSMAKWLLEHGYRFDAGAAQINSQHFERFGMTAETIFDPCTSIGAGGRILTEFYSGAVRRYGAGQEALKAAISAYQTGSYTRGYATGYVGRVTGYAGAPIPQVKAETPRATKKSAATATAAAPTAGHIRPEDAPTAIAW